MKISSSKNLSTNLPRSKFLVEGSNYLLMLGDSNLTYIPLSFEDPSWFYMGEKLAVVPYNHKFLSVLC